MISLAGLSLPCACMSRLLCNILGTAFTESPLPGAALSLVLGSLLFMLPYFALCRVFAPDLWEESLTLFKRKKNRV
jgi:hypothetical protein